MLKAYVGVASKQGLFAFHPERADTLSFVRRRVHYGIRRIGFWAVLTDSEARSVHTLFFNGHRWEAMLLLERYAREIGRILPGDVEHPRHHRPFPPKSKISG